MKLLGGGILFDIIDLYPSENPKKGSHICLTTELMILLLKQKKGFLSDIIRHPNTIVNVADIVEPKDFAEPSHQIIYSNILEIVNQGRKLGFLGTLSKNSEAITSLTR